MERPRNSFITLVIVTSLHVLVSLSGHCLTNRSVTSSCCRCVRVVVEDEDQGGKKRKDGRKAHAVSGVYKYLPS
ncbi:hypothetical protein E2C01_084936 [Portunus trituberculatus]|uniref:Secreted protein n=1 Tax=Portunus trituberculatus TaxID=210409 RepID=A0A5B7IZL5_PORTR|nr:hypothetical protein [Portunus trituberculatus]